MAGFSWAKDKGYDVVVEMDADGSHAPEELPVISATKVLPRSEFRGLRCWVKPVAARNIGGNLSLRWPVPLQSPLRDQYDRYLHPGSIQ